MKSLLKLTFVFTLFPFTQSFGQELITNGGFEAENQGEWTNHADKIAIFQGAWNTDGTLWARTGNYHMILTNERCEVRQTIAVEAGKTYTIDSWYQYSTADATKLTSIGAAYATDDGSGGEILTDISLVSVANPGTGGGIGNWVQETHDFTVPVGITDPIFLRISHGWRNSTPNNTTLWDDISVVEKGYVPPPPVLIDPETTIGQQPEGSVPGDWEIEFSDEFNGSASPAPNPDRWIESLSTSSRAPRAFQGVDGWYFKPDHVSINGVGQLELRASKISNDPVDGSGIMHTGGVLTKNLYDQQYGYFEAKIEIASTQKGSHTAFWLQGHNMGNVDGTGNDGAEVDIFESAWTDDNTKAVVHIDGYGSDHRANTRPYTVPGMHSGYHVFGLYWDAEKMEIYYDGVKKTTYWDIWVPRVPEFLLVTVGASFGDGEFNLQPIGDLSVAKVDWVRAYKLAGAVAVEDNFAGKTFSIYPNPAKNFVNIKSQEDNYLLTIYDLNGRVLHSTKENKSTSVDVSSFSKGLYLFNIITKNDVEVHKIIVD